jgi:hypothetical protein
VRFEDFPLCEALPTPAEIARSGKGAVAAGHGPLGPNPLANLDSDDDIDLSGSDDD